MSPPILTYIKEVPLPITGESVEIHRCYNCTGVFGIDSTYVDQVTTQANCPMCDRVVTLSDPDTFGAGEAGGSEP